MQERLQMRVLGPVTVERAGRPLALGSRLQRRLLAALVLAGGATVSADRLVEALWGQEPPPAAHNSLQSHVSRLRTALGDPGVVVSRPPGYALDATRVDVDAAAFEAALRQARAAQEHEPTRAAAVLDAALAAWRGDAYAEFADDFARAEAVRLNRLRADAALLAGQALLRAGDTDGALDRLARLSSSEPLREDVALAAARAFAAAGRTTEALATLREFRARLADELGLDPGDEVASLEGRLLRGEASPTRPRPTEAPSRVEAPPSGTELAPSARSAPALPPRAGTPTVGRDDDLARLQEALGDGPLVTVVGPGGVGKTRLAMSVAASWRERDVRVAWVDLARASSPDDVPATVADALGVGLAHAEDGAVATALARFGGLVVLDNCEHVLDPLAALVHHALGRTQPASTLLATSRERLDVDGERIVALGPLPVPRPAAATAEDPVVRLFTDRLTAAGGTPVAPSVAAEVAAVVDGLPLAVELAAVRAATLPVGELLARLREHLDVLAGTARRHGARHRTLTDVIAWSYDLLEPRERMVFRRLSVFAAAFSLAAAERVCADGELPLPQAADAVARLVETSMLSRVSRGRYRLLEPLRLFARRQLDEAPDADATRARHREALLDTAARARGALPGPDEPEVVADVEDSLADLRAVHARALADGDADTVARLAAGLYRFAYAQARPDLLTWGASLATPGTNVAPGLRLPAIAAAVTAASWRGQVGDARRLARHCERALHDDSLDPWAGAVVAEVLADLTVMLGRLNDAAAAYERNLVLARRLGHDGIASFALSGLAVTRSFERRSVEAERLARQASELAVSSGAPTARSLARYALGEALAERDPDAALEAFDAAVADAALVRARFFEGIARTADVALRGRHGDPATALARYRTALGMWVETGATGFVVTTLRNLVVLLVRVGRDRDALLLHAALERLASRHAFGGEAERLALALEAAAERLAGGEAADARRRGAAVADLDAAAGFGLAAIDAAMT